MLLTLCFISVQKGFSQNETIEHKVKKGETVYAIARKYDVNPSEIINLNTNAGDIIFVDDILKIPKRENNSANQPSSIVNFDSSYLVKKGDTKYGLAKKFKVSINELEENNPIIINGLQAGHKLKVPLNNSGSSQPVEKTKASISDTLHTISSGETFYSISKRYNISLNELVNANPNVNVNALKIGSSINIPTVDTNTTSDDYSMTNYLVKKGDTKYGLAKKFNVSINQLESLNPNIKSILKHGIEIQIPTKNTNENIDTIAKNNEPKNQKNTEIAFEEIKINGDSINAIEKNINTYKDLTESIVTTKNNTIWFVLPFSKEEYKTFSNKTNTKDNSDPYLTQNIDFFRGAKKALDSIDKLGLTVSYHVIKKDTTKASNYQTDYLKEINENSIVISPYTEAVSIAKAIQNNNIPVISYTPSYNMMLPDNFIQAFHTDKDLKLRLINYLNTDNSNVILISDKDRNHNKNLFTENISNVKIIETSKRKGIDESVLVSNLEKEKNNYVVIDSKRKNMFLNATNVLLKESSKFTIQLAVIEPSIIPDNKSISSKRYKVLNLIYPIENKSKRNTERLKFIENYKSIYNTQPSNNYLLGFDITYDSLLRNNQIVSFNETMNQKNTEQMLMNFQYVKNETGGYINNNISIFEYNKTIDSEFEKE